MSSAPGSAVVRRTVLTAVVALGLGTGAVAKLRDLRVAFLEAPRSSVSADVRSGAAELQRLIGPDAAAVHVSTDGDWSGCGVWQRVLHPNPVACCRVADPASVSSFREYRRQRVVRYAFGTGTPPSGLDLPASVRKVPGGLWLVDLEGRR